MSYTIEIINPSETIGDSLNTVNQNYTTLSDWVIDIQKLYDDKLSPLYEFYIKYSNRMDRTLTNIQNVSSDWRSFQTTVETESSRWLQPLSIWYPDLMTSPFEDSSLVQVKNWLVENFPIKNLDDSVNYVEGQEFIVNCYTYRIQQKINRIDYLIDSTPCRTSNTTIYAYCSDTWSAKSIVCNNGTFNCAYTHNCKVGKESDCYYLTPYYYNPTDVNPIGTVNTHATTGWSRITANVNSKYTDRFENANIKSISFRVIDCDWSFNKFIT